MPEEAKVRPRRGPGCRVMLIGTQCANLGFQLEAVQIMLIMCYTILTTIIEMVFIKMFLKYPPVAPVMPPISQ